MNPVDQVVEAQVGAQFDRAMPAITTVQLVKYAGASDDYNRIHYDQHYATQEAGLGGVIAHGMLTMAFMGSAITEWAGSSAFVKHLDARFTAPVRPGDVVCVKASVEQILDADVHLALRAMVGDRTVAAGSAIVERRA